jgi:uncharacterized protein (DUF2235 family)
MKRIVLCFDGTWNTPADDGVPEDRRVETNARRFYNSVAPRGPDGTDQEPWYNEGVGAHVLTKLPGGAFGAGLDKHILDGYRHLSAVYADGDEVYVLGFSRGAYTARSLVGMVRSCGLLRADLPDSLAWVAYGIYRTRRDGPDSEAAAAFRKQFARDIRFRFVGVWDTVGALGLPLHAAIRLNAALYQFHDTRLSGIVDRAYHALAVDENRAEYAATLWEPAERPGQVIEQRWFPGSHADVGGGYPDRRLSDVSLRWMQDRAADAGLAVSPVGVADDNYAGTSTDSYLHFLRGLYRLEHPRYFRPVGATQFGNERVDASVDRRAAAAGLGYRPPNPGLADAPRDPAPPAG